MKGMLIFCYINFKDFFLNLNIKLKVTPEIIHDNERNCLKIKRSA